MKAGAAHRVPLSAQALQVVQEAMGLRDSTGLLFPGVKGVMYDTALSNILRDAGLSDHATVHGFRTTFKTWCIEQTDTPWAVGEAALAHTLGNSTEQAYARSDLFQRRRGLMDAWAAYAA